MIVSYLALALLIGSCLGTIIPIPSTNVITGLSVDRTPQCANSRRRGQTLRFSQRDDTESEQASIVKMSKKHEILHRDWGKPSSYCPATVNQHPQWYHSCLRTVLQPFIQKSVREKLNLEFKLVSMELELKFPVIYDVERPETAEFYNKLPSKVKPVLFTFLKVERFFRFIGIALRASVITALKYMFTEEASRPMVDVITKSIMANLKFPQFWDLENSKNTFYASIHPKIMYELARRGIPNMVQYSAAQSALFAARGVQAFFLRSRMENSKAPGSLADIEFDLLDADLGEGMYSDDEDWSHLETINSLESIPSAYEIANSLDKNVVQVAERIGKSLSQLTVDVLRSVIVGILYATSGIVKHTFLLMANLPPVNHYIKCFFETNLLRAYVSGPKITKLPSPVYAKHLNSKNLWDGAKTKKERIQIVEETLAGIEEEKERRRSHAVRL